MLSTLEENARRAKYANSFYDYKPGSATAEYNEYCKAAEEAAAKAKERLSKTSAPAERAERVDYLLNLYKTKKLSWLNETYAVRARVPSVMIAGPANFPVRAKEKQIARLDTLNEQDPDYILEEIRGIGRNAKTIYSDEANAVERIKAKIESLKGAPDPYGNKAAEIRRLKERLLQLAPDEMKAGKQITINGQPATFENIVNVFNSFKPQRSRYSPEENRFYLSIPFVISDGTRNYKCFVSCETTENGMEISTYGNADNGYKTIWKPLNDKSKFNLMITQMNGSGNKAVIYSILKDLSQVNEVKPETPEAGGDETTETVTINGESVQVVRNKEEMRLQLIFDGKPDEKTREILKSNGFRWAPSQSAWQRLLNSNAEWALKRITAA